MTRFYDEYMPMQPRKVRASEALWDLFEEAADQEGISVSQLMREATIAYIAWHRARREPLDDLGQVYDQLMVRIRAGIEPEE